MIMRKGWLIATMLLAVPAGYGQQAQKPSVQPQITVPKSEAPAAQAPKPTPKPEPKPDIAALKKQAEAGDPAAANRLGDALSMGVLGFREFAEAAKWYRKAAEGGNVRAQTKIGMLYEGGFGIERDPKQAIAWYEKAASQNDLGAIMRLAYLHYRGMGIEKNETEGLKWFAKAAEMGVVEAQIELGDAYKNGLEGIVQPDPVQAMKWYRMAADQNDATGLYLVGRMYEEGRGVPASTEEAKKWYLTAAQKGSPQARAALRKLQY
jgi:TPR repeat protein